MLIVWISFHGMHLAWKMLGNSFSRQDVQIGYQYVSGSSKKKFFQKLKKSREFSKVF